MYDELTGKMDTKAMQTGREAVIQLFFFYSLENSGKGGMGCY